MMGMERIVCLISRGIWFLRNFGWCTEDLSQMNMYESVAQTKYKRNPKTLQSAKSGLVAAPVQFNHRATYQVIRKKLID